MWNTTFVRLFGQPAANVTIDQLLRHKSGIADCDVTSYESRVLARESHSSHSPFEDLSFIANLTGPLGCSNGTCTWLFQPGSPGRVAYSSTNYVLANLVLLKFAPPGKDTWQAFSLADALELEQRDFRHTHFATQGPMNQA